MVKSSPRKRVFEIINNKSGFSNLSQLQGKELSHNNYLDTFNAYSLVNDFKKIQKSAQL